MDRVCRFKNLNIKIIIYPDKYFNKTKYFTRPNSMSILQKDYSPGFRFIKNKPDR